MRYHRVLLVSLMVVATAGTGAAAETVIRAAGYVDVETGGIVSPAVIVVDGDKIAAVNPDALPSAVHVDLSGLVLLPGLIDVHTHLTGDISGDWTVRPVKEREGDAALRGARNAKRTLMAGFTTVRDLGSFNGGADVSLMHAIDKGFVPGPRVIPARQSISITGGHCDVTGFAPGILELGPEDGIADGADEVIAAVRYQIKHGARVIKVCATAGVLSFGGPVGAQQMSATELAAAVEETHRHGLRIAAHAHGTEGIKAAIRAGVDSIEHGSLLDDEAIRLLKKHGTFLTMNLYPPGVVDLDSMPPQIRAKAEYVFPRREQSFRSAVAAGVKLPYGTDAGVYPHGLNAQQFAVKVGLGQKPADAIRSATTVAADLLDVEDRGRIAEGLLADIIAVAGNPLDDVTVLENVSFVMKGGEVFKQP